MDLSPSEALALEFMEACNLTQGHRVPIPAQSFFIPGRAPGDYAGLLEKARQLWYRQPATKVVIPGHDASYKNGTRMPDGYPGFENWKRQLSQPRQRSSGISPDSIISCVVRPERQTVTHTREETDGFVLRAKEHGWKTVGVLAHANQQPRVMCCMLASSKEFGYPMKIVPLAPDETDWKEVVRGSLGELEAPRYMQIRQEFIRILDYIRKEYMVPLSVLKEYLTR